LKKKPAKKYQSITKLNLWIKFYLDSENKETFLNKAGASRAAGYNCKGGRGFSQIGCQNFNKLQDKIKVWIDDNGLSDNALKIKLLDLLEVTETKFFSTPEKNYNGDTVGIIIVERQVPALAIQAKALDMAFKAKGLYVPENDLALSREVLDSIFNSIHPESAAKLKKMLLDLHSARDKKAQKDQFKSKK